MLEVKDLLLVRALVEEGGATRAGARLHLSQSAVSHHLRRLEQRLGVPLFVRDGKKMTATGEAERMVSSSTPILDAMRALERQLLGDRALANRIRLATECYTCYHWLPPLLEEFERHHPDTEVAIAIEATREPLEALGRGELDLAICHSRPTGRGLIKTPLFEDEWVVALPPGHPLAKKKVIMPSELCDQTLIIHDAPGRNLERTSAKLFKNGPPARVIKLPLTEAIVELVKANRGVSILARWAIRPAVEAGELIARPLGRPGFVRSWSAVYRRKGPLTAPLAALTDLLASALGGGLLD